MLKIRTKTNWAFDRRWIGNNGIGRFAKELDDRLAFDSLPIDGNPSGALDVVRVTKAVVGAGRPVFSPGYSAPILGLKRVIITIHDLSYLDINHSIAKKIYCHTVMRWACLRAHAIFTVSEFSKKRIVDVFRVNPKRIINVGNGVSEVFSVDGPRVSQDTKFLLCIGNRKKHKNEARVIEAFARAKVDPGLHLFFNGLADPSLTDLARQLNVEGRVRFLGLLPEPELAAYYRSAEALVFPSLYEGFGFPLVEAMASGTPVLTSRNGSLPEIAGDAALYVDALDVDSIAAGIERIVTDDKLRQTLIAAGMTRSERFTWGRVAESVATALNQVAA